MKEDNKGYNSIYRAIVVSTQDPLELGRIRIRVPFLHGTNTANNSKCIPDENLPFANPCTIFASQDAGMFILPEVGSMVFVMFENGSTDKPIYLGQMFSKSISDVSEYTSPNTSAFVGSDNKRVRKACVNDTPAGTYKEGVFKKYTLFKSPKGATIEFDDSDEQETLSVFDRLGQSFVMHSPTTQDYSESGINTRGTFNVLKSKFNRALQLTSLILLKAICGSYIRLASRPDSSSTDIVTIYEDIEAGIHIDIGKDNRILIFYKDTCIELSDDINLISKGTINLNAKTINLDADIINTSTQIHVCDVESVDVVKYVDTKDETSID